MYSEGVILPPRPGANSTAFTRRTTTWLTLVRFGARSDVVVGFGARHLQGDRVRGKTLRENPHNEIRMHQPKKYCAESRSSCCGPSFFRQTCLSDNRATTSDRDRGNKRRCSSNPAAALSNSHVKPNKLESLVLSKVSVESHNRSCPTDELGAGFMRKVHHPQSGSCNCRVGSMQDL